MDAASYEQHLCYVPKGDFIRIYIFDITDRQQILEDPLTGLPNRTLFLDRLGQASKSSKANSEYRFAVLFLDMDNFKGINDNYGHIVADQLLKIVARRLDGCLRPRDIVARLGGDEFTILLYNVREPESAQIVATRIQERLGEPFELACHRFRTSVSIGIAMSTARHQSPSDLLSYADAAMYRAKTLGRTRSVVFDPSSHKKALSPHFSSIPRNGVGGARGMGFHGFEAASPLGGVAVRQKRPRMPSADMAGAFLICFWANLDCRPCRALCASSIT